MGEGHGTQACEWSVDYPGVHERYLRRDTAGVVVRAYNFSTWEAEAGGLL